MTAGLLQLNSQISQLPGVGGIVTYHIFHQGNQLLHGSVLTGRTAGSAVMGTVVVVMLVGVHRAVGMDMLMSVRMVMGMGMLVGVFVGMSRSIGVGMLMDMLMGMGMGVLAAGYMIVIKMHDNRSF